MIFDNHTINNTKQIFIEEAGVGYGFILESVFNESLDLLAIQEKFTNNDIGNNSKKLRYIMIDNLSSSGQMDSQMNHGGRMKISAPNKNIKRDHSTYCEMYKKYSGDTIDCIEAIGADKIKLNGAELRKYKEICLRNDPLLQLLRLNKIDVATCERLFIYDENLRSSNDDKLYCIRDEFCNLHVFETKTNKLLYSENMYGDVINGSRD